MAWLSEGVGMRRPTLLDRNAMAMRSKFHKLYMHDVSWMHSRIVQRYGPLVVQWLEMVGLDGTGRSWWHWH